MNKPLSEWTMEELRVTIFGPTYPAFIAEGALDELVRRKQEEMKARCLTACYGWDVTSILYRDEEIAAAEWARRMCDTAIKELK